MARLARLVVPGLPHHVTQRGNGRAQTFFGEADYALYRDLLAASCRAAKVEVWAWVLMPNHVHLILVPSDEDGLRRALAPVHRRYAGAIHARLKRTGHFWQGRFGAVALDEAHLAAAIRYIALNPVRARLVERASDWRWSSVHAHLSGQSDGLTATLPMLSRFPRFAEFIEAEGEPGCADAPAPRRDRRQAAGRRPVHRGARSPDEPRTESGKARAQTPRRGGRRAAGV